MAPAIVASAVYLFALGHYAVQCLKIVLQFGPNETAARDAQAAAVVSAARLAERERELSESRRRLEREAGTRFETEAALRRSEAKFRSIIEHSSDVVLLTNQSGTITFASAASSRVFGRKPEALVGKSFFDLIVPEEREDRRSLVLSSIESQDVSFTIGFRASKDDGTDLPAEAVISNMLANQAIHSVVVTVSDRSQIKRAEERAEFYEFFDPITRLPNREKFVKELGQALTIARNRTRLLAVMAIGLDRFKHINDVYGTSIGDFLLKTAGERLRDAFRPDDLTARFRGDKFMVFLQDIRSEESLKEIISKANNAFEEPFDLPGGSARFTISIGVAIFPQDGSMPDELLKNAETAMFMAKESGRGGYRLFDARLNAKLIERVRIENEILDGIARDEFFPYFQPKVERDGRIVGAEALIRWRGAGGTLIQPKYFIDVAEKSGSITEIGRIMLRKSCEAVAAWPKLPGARVSVNLSPYQFGREDLVGMVDATLHDVGLDPCVLELEITESGILENEREGVDKLKALHDLGVKLSIDDFGTGYSSFSKLKDFPIDAVKMDKSFVDPVPGDPRAAVIARAIIDLAHTLDYAVIAEGVETREQFNFLDSSSCDQYQGYLFSKPVPGEEFEAMLVRQRLDIVG